MIHRHITAPLLEALSDSPVVLLNGARQTGKSTLVNWLGEHKHHARYLTFDDAGTLTSARHDPAGFLAGMDGNVILDEIQLKWTAARKDGLSFL
jgi:predicted AAA+ superfamily ATPase